VLHFNGPWHRAVGNTTTTKPAFIRIQYYGRLTFFWIGYKQIRAAHFYTPVAATAELGVNHHSLARG